MVMTDEMMIWDKTFQEFLTYIDCKYEDYFSSDKAEAKSVKYYFGIHNGATLKYVPKNLRADIFNEVLQKHKEIWGKWHQFVELEN